MRNILSSCLLAAISLSFPGLPDGSPGDSPVQDAARRAGGRLIPDSTTMVTAWVIPRDPLKDSTLADSPRAARIRRGFMVFMQTPLEAPKFVHNRLSCNNCHLNGGQRERALPLVGVAAAFPEFNRREGRLFSLEDRIVGCFMRSENGTGSGTAFPDSASEEVQALAAYIRWISGDIRAGERIPWRGHNAIDPADLIPVERLDRERGKSLFAEHCSSCHGGDGQGVQIGDKRAGPLWGPESWNDGAGAARIYTLAGFIRYAMPYLNPGSLADEEAQYIAVYINSMPRPVYPLKDADYLQGRVPPDAVYYAPRTGAERR